jgi:leucyl aminopeptidase
MLKMIIGSAWGHKFSFYEADRSTPMDLSNRTVKVLIKKNKDDADENAVLPIMTYQNISENYITPTYTATQTQSIKEGDYYFGIKIYTADDLDRELYNDVLTVSKGVFND